ncbi:hypothetical protein A2Z41_00775 [Microgenomates group bacterium RBG_19FT_COMBO_39_10]|nr:MAG: hypothetical protein A2Z41_00775 [Microgenomates group bacterium RBG_19FT_COMBO_39_10]
MTIESEIGKEIDPKKTTEQAIKGYSHCLENPHSTAALKTILNNPSVKVSFECQGIDFERVKEELLGEG